MADRLAVTWTAYRAMELWSAGAAIDAVIVDTDELVEDTEQLACLVTLAPYLPLIGLSRERTLLDEELPRARLADLRRNLARLDLLAWIAAPVDRDDWGLPLRAPNRAQAVAAHWSQLLVDVNVAPWLENRWQALVPAGNDELGFLATLAEHVPIKISLNVTHLLLDAWQRHTTPETILASLGETDIAAIRISGIARDQHGRLGPHGSLLDDSRIEDAIEAVGAHAQAATWILIDCEPHTPIDAVLAVAERARMALHRGRLRHADGGRW